MTKDNFIKSLDKYWEDYKISWHIKDPEIIVNNAYSIAKTQSIVDYLKYITQCNNFFLKTDYKDIKAYKLLTNKILPIISDNFDLVKELYEYEYDYDIPMWCTYDNISKILFDHADNIIVKIQNRI